MRTRRAAALALAGLALAGCGSTITSSAIGGRGAATTGGLADDGLGLEPATPAPTQAGAIDAGGDLGVGSTQSPTDAPMVDDTDPSTSDSSGGTSSGPALGRGVTATTISIGIVYTPGAAAANSAAGANGVSQGDEHSNFELLAKDVNAHGGIAGRKLQFVYYSLPASTTKPYAQIDQELCAFFGQDHKVFAVNLDGVSSNGNFAACMEKAGVIMIDTGKIIKPDSQTMREEPDFYEMSTATTDRLFADQVSTLVRLKYFTGWQPNGGTPSTVLKPKVGVLYVNLPSVTRPVKSVLLPALQKAGFPASKTDIIAVTAPQATTDLAALAAATSSAVLKFHSDGVTHALVLDLSGTLTLLFTTAARNQGYVPRLGANTASGMQALYDGGDIAPDQLRGAMGLGWIPSLDLPTAEQAKYRSSAATACLNLMAKAGVTFSDANARSIALGDCEIVNLLRDVLAKASAPTRLAFRAAADAFGRSFISTGTLHTFLGRGHHDALAAGYDMVWDGSCRCAKYVGSHLIP